MQPRARLGPAVAGRRQVAYGHAMSGETDPAIQPPVPGAAAAAGTNNDVPAADDPHAAEPEPYTGERLPSHPSGGAVVAGMFATLDHLLLNRPRPVTEISEEYREPWAKKDGISVEGLEERPDHPEPPDRSGARL
jgi:hypothetical protein